MFEDAGRKQLCDAGRKRRVAKVPVRPDPRWSLSVRVCAQRQENRVGILRQEDRDMGRGIGTVPGDAERPQTQVPLFVCAIT